MELLDRYLQAVKKYLPSRRQQDIIAELRANMESQLEDKESELGRPISQSEAEDWLKKMGPPILVAARYQPQQYLIGPAVFPIYLYVLRMAMVWAILIYAIVMCVVIPLVTENGTALIESVFRIPGMLITVAVWVTGIFAALEFFTARNPGICPRLAALTGAWSPSTLPPLEKAPAAGGKPRSFAKAVAEIVFGLLFLGWLLLIPRHPFLLMGPGVVFLTAGPFELSPAWWTFFWWIVALNVLQIVWHGVDLVRGKWEYPSSAQKIAFKTFGLIPLGLMIAVRDNAYVLLKNPAVDQARYGSVLDTINKSVHLGLLVICAIASLQLIWDFGKWIVQAYGRRAAAR
jgi:hypothetical protein